MPARFKAQIYSRALAGIVGSNPGGGGMDVCLVQCLCCQVEVSATGRSLVQRSPTECDVSKNERDHEAPRTGQAMIRNGS
jgi:hypothetical protein